MSVEKEPVEIFAGTPWEAEMVKSLLENEGIAGFLLNEAGTVSHLKLPRTVRRPLKSW